MVLTIHPAVSGGKPRWMLDTLLYTLGTTLGALGTVTAVALAADGARAIGGEALVTVVLIAGLTCCVGRDIGLPLPVPFRGKQVPEHARQFLPRSVMVVVFGVMLGVGFLTLFTYAVPIGVLVVASQSASAVVAVAMCATYAAGKSFPLLIALCGHDEVDVTRQFVWSTTSMRALRYASAACTLWLMGYLISR
ncbi:MAG: hypothetical protein ACRDQZ_16885 [Mycobacteriales bacterium]